MTLAKDILTLFESVKVIKVVPNGEAITLLKSAYLSGKNKNNEYAKWVNTSRDQDYLLVELSLSDINFKNGDKNQGIVDSTVNPSNISKMSNIKEFPPVLVGYRKGIFNVLDGGHRIKVYHDRGVKRFQALITVDKFEQGFPNWKDEIK